MNGPDSCLLVLADGLPFVGRSNDLLSFVSESKEAAETDGNRYQKHA